jgi:hypothetical protein
MTSLAPVGYIVPELKTSIYSYTISGTEVCVDVRACTATTHIRLGKFGMVQIKLG